MIVARMLALRNHLLYYEQITMIFTYATDGVDFRTIEMSERLSQ